MRLAFISDLHLSANTPRHNQIFYAQMQKWQNELDALYILGDFFDFWCGDDDDNAFIREVKLSLKQFTSSKPIYFIWGNHDFAIGKKFVKETGITIIKDCTTITVGTNIILLSHGDIFCTLDIDYQKSKKRFRNPLVLWILRRTPLSWRYKLKDKLEHSANKSFNKKPPETYHVVDATIAKIAKQHKANIVIHGHTHNPNYYTVNSKHGIIRRIEIPDWVDRPAGGYVILENGDIQIRIPENAN